MRTTIDIPEDLIKEAMRVTKSPTKTELIKKALYNIIQKNKIKSLKKFLSYEKNKKKKNFFCRNMQPLR